MNSMVIVLVVGAFLMEVLSLFFPDNPLKVFRELRASTFRLCIHLAISVGTNLVGLFAFFTGVGSFRTTEGIGYILVGAVLTAYSGYETIEGLRRLRLRRRLALTKPTQHGSAQ